jgi:[ribosomal protein S5]-alanine N-acetyltransferase
MLLVTPRLALRPLELDDAAHFARLLGGDPAALRQMAQMPVPCTEAAAQDWIATRLGPGAHIFGILQRSDNSFVGVVGFGGDPAMPEMGYWIGQPYRGKGYATEAIIRVVEHAATLDVPRIHADTFLDNPASARVLAKAGFVTTGQVQRVFPARGGRRELLRHERVPGADGQAVNSSG